MDTRAYSKGYEEYYRRAEKKYGVQYTRCRISDLREDPATHNLIVRYQSDQQSVVSSQPPEVSARQSRLRVLEAIVAGGAAAALELH